MSDTSYKKQNGSCKSAFWRATAFAILASMLAAGSVGSAFVQNAYAANTLTVNGLGLDGRTLGMWIVISSGGSTVKSGSTPLTFAGTTGATYTIQAQNYGTITFDHWDNGSMSPSRTLALSSDRTITAYYRTASTHNLVVNSAATSGGAISGYYTTISSSGTTVKTGFTSLSFAGNHGASYTVSVSDYGGMVFDHWDNGSATRARALTLNSDMVVIAYFRSNAVPSTYALTVSSATTAGSALTGYYTVISQGSSIAKTGFTPLTYDAKAGATYTVSVSDYGKFAFDHWENGSTARARTVTLNADTAITAFYRDTTPNSNPAALDDSATTNQDSSVTVNVLANDSDADGDALTVSSTAAPGNGSAQVNSDNTVTYTPAAGYSGTDSFAYTVSDTKGGSGSATVSVQVAALAPQPPANDAPVAGDQGIATAEDTSILIALNASDGDGDALGYSIVTAPAHGTLAGTDGSRTYTPDANYNGPDSFSFTASDGFADSNVATVSITVNSVNDAPVADDQSVATGEDSPVSIVLSATDADGDALAYVVGAPAHGALTGTAPNLTYTPDGNYSGADSFTFKANDGTTDSNEATVALAVSPVNDAPVSSDQSVSTAEDTAVTVALAVSDVEGDALSYSVGSPSHGTLSGSAPSLVYMPAANYSGPDSFTFRANDGSLDSNIATVSITISSVNDGPVAVNDSTSTSQGTATTLSVLANDSDVEGDVLTVASVTAPAHGSATIKADNTVTYAPAAGYSGQDSFGYTVSDGNGGTAGATVAITVNAAPAQSTYVLTVSSADMYGNANSGLYTVISKAGSTVKTGFTSLAYTGSAGATYSVTVSDYGSSFFDHWDNGSTARARTVTLNADTAITAVFRVPSLVVNPASGVGGTSVTATGTYFSPNSAVKVTYNGAQVASATTNSAGAFAATFAAPSLGTGSYTVQATDGKGWKASARFDDTTKPAPHPLKDLILKTGVYVALYMYPSGSGATWWQKVIDEKTKHPSVPIVAAFNPNSGPGNFKDNNIANWVTKMRNAGVIMIGYTFDDYGTRSLTALKADADKYKNWYNADGLFIDEFTNKVGFETHYRDLTTYVKSIGMNMTMGNPGTDVPKSYIGTVDVINITEGRGYMPISWLQYCINCSASNGWHYQYDKLNFAYIRYDISTLDTSFETESAKWAGLLYITDGNDADGRWFHLPPYFSTLVATLDK